MGPMRKVSDYFVPYEGAKKLFRELHTLTGVSNPTEIQYNIFQVNIERKVWPLLMQAKFYIIESDYTETEWKDMISEHYIHTKYNVNPKVIRVHLFNAEQEITNAYLGCFTLRKIDNNDMTLSFIYPNWNVLRLEECNYKNSYIMTANKYIHIYGEELVIKTTPYFAQDGTVTCCAHASILMMSHFLNLRFGYKKIRIPEIAQGYLRREKQYPTKGLIPEQIMEVLTNNGVYIRPYNLAKKGQYKETAEDIKQTIKAHLRSGLPVLMGINKHAVLIVGFREDEEYDGILFLDDSGVLIHNVNEDEYAGKEFEYDNFISSCSWDYIFEFIEQGAGETVRFLIPFHEKVFVNYDDVYNRCLSMERDINLSSFEGECIYSFNNKRFFIADNVICKRFINENVLDRDYVEQAVDEFLRSEQPHYLWCYEFEFEGELFILFLDSTYNMDTNENNMYINKNCEPFHIAKHFHTVDSVKVIEIEDIPLFANRVQRKGGFLESYTQQDDMKMRTKTPKKPVKRLENPLMKTKKLKSDTPEKKEKKRRNQ